MLCVMLKTAVAGVITWGLDPTSTCLAAGLCQGNSTILIAPPFPSTIGTSFGGGLVFCVGSMGCPSGSVGVTPAGGMVIMLERPPGLSFPNGNSFCATKIDGGAVAGSWRLPTINELNAIYPNRYLLTSKGAQLPNFPFNYWSTTRASPTNLYVKNFNGGAVTTVVDTYNYMFVLCVRAF